MIWFFSDPHYGHANIVKGISQWSDLSGCRDFPTQEAHDTHLVQLLNLKVGRLDTLWCLGDWSFGGIANIAAFREQIQCDRIHFILGNHDHHIASGRAAKNFETVQSYKELQCGSKQLVLMHYPLESWNNMERGSVHLHGHVHGQGRQLQGRYDVGIEAKGLVSLEDIASWPTADSQRHRTIEGGNKFAQNLLATRRHISSHVQLRRLGTADEFLGSLSTHRGRHATLRLAGYCGW